jgi:uncharacterized protein YbbK (DUF523 family)
MILVSACLLGVNCRYDGGNCAGEYDVTTLSRKELLIPVCPEQLGGMPTPRMPCHIVEGDGDAVIAGNARVIDQSGMDVTEAFVRGAHEVLKIARFLGIQKALLKELSPSCGAARIKRCSHIVPGRGVTAALLAMNGILVVSSEQIFLINDN